MSEKNKTEIDIEYLEKKKIFYSNLFHQLTGGVYLNTNNKKFEVDRDAALSLLCWLTNRALPDSLKRDPISLDAFGRGYALYAYIGFNGYWNYGCEEEENAYIVRDYSEFCFFYLECDHTVCQLQIVLWRYVIG